MSGFYCAFGLEPSRNVPERGDNVALELEFVAFLLEKLVSLRRVADLASAKHEAVCRDALAAFVADHVAWWIPPFGRCLEKRVAQLGTNTSCDPSPRDARLLSGVAQLLCAWVAAERTATGIEPYRRIVGPPVAPPAAANQSCATCATCADVTT